MKNCLLFLGLMLLPSVAFADHVCIGDYTNIVEDPAPECAMPCAISRSEAVLACWTQFECNETTCSMLPGESLGTALNPWLSYDKCILVCKKHYPNAPVTYCVQLCAPLAPGETY